MKSENESLMPNPVAQLNATCVITVMDYATHWVEAYKLPNEQAPTVVKALRAPIWLRIEIDIRQWQKFCVKSLRNQIYESK